MVRKNPIHGLLLYSFHSAIGGVISAILLSVALGVALLYTGNDLVERFFGLVAIGGPAYIVIVSMGGKTGGRWERYQLAMPVRRCDIATSQYLLVLLASLIGFPLFIMVLGVNTLLNGVSAGATLASTVTSALPFVSMPLVFAGLLFPLACTPMGEEREEGLALICLVAGALYMSIMPWIGQSLGLSSLMTTLLTVGISLALPLCSVVTGPF